jgi:hypothetical protein
MKPTKRLAKLKARQKAFDENKTGKSVGGHVMHRPGSLSK